MHRTAQLLTLLVTLASFVYPAPASSQSWSTIFGPPPAGQGLNDFGYVLLVYQDRLIVGGDFTQAGPVAANRVAAWDGTQWSAFGSGFGPHAVWALTEYNGELIAAGSGGLLMRWNGSTWSSLTPPGTTATFYTVHAHAGLLFVNTRAGSVSNLSWWDGSSWSSVPMPTYSPYPNLVLGMASYQGQLYLTGSVPITVGPWFDYDGFLCSWDGSAFHGPGHVFSSDAYCLHVHDDLLYVGKTWSSNDPPLAQQGVAIWDGSDWVPVPFLYDLEALSLETYYGRLVVGGYGVTSFDGATQVPLDTTCGVME